MCAVCPTQPHGVLGYILLPCFLLALVWNEGYEPFEILWYSRRGCVVL
jgi:hypothetical protein